MTGIREVPFQVAQDPLHLYEVHRNGVRPGSAEALLDCLAKILLPSRRRAREKQKFSREVSE